MKGYGYRQELGGAFFYIEHAGGRYELAAEELNEFRTHEEAPEEGEDGEPHPGIASIEGD